jgi:hypothetical protein
MDWAVFFPDGMHAKLQERWYPVGRRLAGRVLKGYREHFSFHYGPTNAHRDSEGFPVRDKVGHPAIIRIDRDKYGPHIHFHDEADHIPQSRVAGMIIDDADMFDFVRAVLEFRRSGRGFDDIMGFTVSI